jgi:phage terminase Nu1 subunit (DNA packaging protein)
MSLDETSALDRVETADVGASRPAPDPSRPIRVEVSRLMELFQMTDSGVRSLVRKGIIPKPSAGGYFFDASITGYVTYLRKYAKGRPNWDDADNGPSDRSRLLKAKADIEELKAQELDGRLVSVDAVAETLSSITTTIRNRLLAIPSRAATLVVGEDDPDVIQAQLEALVHEALTELSEGEIEVVGSGS